MSKSQSSVFSNEMFAFATEMLQHIFMFHNNGWRGHTTLSLYDSANSCWTLTGEKQTLSGQVSKAQVSTFTVLMKG